jgi:sulfite reductase beta subunit-like hemoprotein
VLGHDKREGSSYFLRIKIPNGRLSAEQFKAIAGLAQIYGRGYAEITDRQNLQLHWIESQNAQDIFSKLDKIGFSTDHGGQGIPTAKRGDVRAIVSCPAAGIDKHELMDAWPIVKQLDNFFNGNRDFLDLPRKLKISISTCELNCGNPEIHDLSFVAVKQKSNEIKFAVLVGGTIASSPELARPLNVLVKPEEILDVAKSTAEIFRDFGSRENKAKARFRWLVDAWGTEKLRKAIEEKMGKTLETYPLEHLPTCKGEHAGVQSQKQKGYSYINIPIVNGVLSSEKMVKIARISEEYGNGDLRLTPFQNIILTNMPDEVVNLALKDLSDAGYPVADMCFHWTTIACAGNFCGKTLGHPKNNAKETVAYLNGRFGGNLKDTNISIGFSGCPNGCARHLIADIGLQGTAVIGEGKTVPGYNLYIREKVGLTPRLGKLIQRGIKAEQVKFALGNLIEAYLKKQNRSFNEFCNVKTVEELQAILNLNLKQD